MSLALLTPVPLVHLEDGVVVCERQGRVAFGSQAWETFRHLDEAQGSGARILIYASHAQALGAPRVTWTAAYLRYVESRGGAHPDGARYRPSSTVAGGEDAAGYWAGFYEVESLRLLDEAEVVKVGDLRDRNGRSYRRNFVPEGPILIRYP